MRGKWALLLLLAWYFAVGKDTFGPFESRAHCDRVALATVGLVHGCYCVLMFPTDCMDLVN